MPVSERERDVEVASASKGLTGASRNVIAVIGIDHYHHWPALSNAVRDATGAAALFQRLGFEEVTAPLLDERATGKAIQSLVTDDLMGLGPEDSLVLFYAGHGGTRKHRLGGEEIKTGYLIPVDALSSADKVSTWIDLEGWLRAVSLLPAKHILVVLDACHSGIALDPIIKWRDIGSWQNTSLSTLQARRSRRIITSALDDQVALDSGPVHGHSLFTGCLIEGLTDGIARGGSRVITGSELGLYVQRRVQTYPHARQTPDFGTFAFDDRGEMVIPFAIERVIEEPAASEAVSPAWLDLIDLDDKPEPVSVAEPRPSSADSGSEGEVGSVTISTAEPDLPPPAGAAAKPVPAFDTGPHPDDDVAADRSQPGFAQPALNPMASPPPNPIPSLENVASIAPTRELAEPASAERASTPIAKLTASTPNVRRWIVVGAVGTTLAAGLIGYILFGHESPRGDLPLDTPPRNAATNPPDDPPKPTVANSPTVADSHAEGAPPDSQQTSGAGSQKEGTQSLGEQPLSAANSHAEGSSPGGQPKTTAGSRKRGSSPSAGQPKSAAGSRAEGSPRGGRPETTPGSLAQAAGAQADVLFRQGRELLAAGKVDEACSAFEESQKFEPAVATLLNLATCREKLSQLATAWGLFLDAARQTRSAGDARSQQLHDLAQVRAQKLEPRVSHLTINVPQKSQVDGLEITRGTDRIQPGLWNHALPIDGGTYTITARAPGFSPWSTQVTIAAESDTRTIEIPDLRNLSRDRANDAQR